MDTDVVVNLDQRECRERYKTVTPDSTARIPQGLLRSNYLADIEVIGALISANEAQTYEYPAVWTRTVGHDPYQTGCLTRNRVQHVNSGRLECSKDDVRRNRAAFGGTARADHATTRTREVHHSPTKLDCGDHGRGSRPSKIAQWASQHSVDHFRCIAMPKVKCSRPLFEREVSVKRDEAIGRHSCTFGKT